MSVNGRAVTAWAALGAWLALGCGLQSAGQGSPDGVDADSGEYGGDYEPPDDGRVEDVTEDRPARDDATGDEGAMDEGVEDAPVEDAGPVCGNGTVEAPEECDAGADNSDDRPDACRTDCRRAHCGDGVRDTGEACDDGNGVDDDGCRNDCSVRGCGDGIVEGLEACDDGNSDNTDDCLNTCVEATCGDGFIRVGVEVCDTPVARGCTTGCGTAGTQACTGCAWSATCAPPLEVCNGVDDDCVGGPDDAFACAKGATRVCTVGFCPGMQTCEEPACEWGACTGLGAPANDSCGGTVIDVGAGGVFGGNTCGAADDYTGGCGDAGGADVVYHVTIPAAGADLFATTVGSSIDTVLYLRRDSCTSPNYACQDDYRAGTSTGTVLLADNLPAGDYYLIVDGKSAAAQGDYRLEINISANSAEGDRCGQPAELPTGTTHACGSHDGMNNDTGGSCGGGGQEEFVYYVVVPAARTLTFSNCDAGTSYDSLQYLRRACADGATEVACNDDAGVAACPSDYRRSMLTATLEPGIYYLFVDGYNYHGTFCVNVSGW